MEIRQLLNKRILVFDGAMGTMLQKYGLPTGETPELFNFTHPEILKDIHRQYLSAGSDIISTNTFGANRLKVGVHKLHSPFLSLLYIYYIIIFKICQLYPSKSYIYEDNLNLHRYNKNLVELDKC